METELWRHAVRGKYGAGPLRPNHEGWSSIIERLLAAAAESAKLPPDSPTPPAGK